MRAAPPSSAAAITDKPPTSFTVMMRLQSKTDTWAMVVVPRLLATVVHRSRGRNSGIYVIAGFALGRPAEWESQRALSLDRSLALVSPAKKGPPKRPSIS